MQRRTGVIRPEFNNGFLIHDNQYDSQYFKVADVPTSLTSGKNLFTILGDDRLLVREQPILIQVVDVNGNPIYHHINNYMDSTGRLHIGVWVYPETVPGLGRIDIIAIAQQRPDGGPVNKNWQNKYNVKWSRDIMIQPTKPNTTPIIFKKVPGVKITEHIREYLTQTYLTGTSVTTSYGNTNKTLSYTYSGYGDAYLSITGGTFTADMVGGYLEIPDPGYTLPGNYALSPGESIEYTGYISQILNSTTAKIGPYTIPVTSNTSLANPRPGTTSTALSSVNSIIPPDNFGPVSNYTMSWQQDATYATGSQNSQSFASITLKNLDPLVGNIYSIKTYMKSHGYADFDLLGENILRERDLLINVDSALAYDRIGDFKNLSTINTYWASSSIGQAHPFNNIHSDTMMISSMVITGSGALSASGAYIKVNNKTGIDMYQDNEYTIQFNVVAVKTDGQTLPSKMDVYVSSSDGTQIAFSDSRNIGEKIVTLESEIQVASNVESFTNANNNVNTTTTMHRGGTSGQSTVPTTFLENTTTDVLDINNPTFDERQMGLSFTPSKDTKAHLVFVVTEGTWYISDVSIEGANDYGFTPNHTFVEIPIQAPQSDDILDFKFEFYNIDGIQSNLALTTQSLDFVGSNLFISGNNNQLSGSVIIGNGIIMQGFRAG